MNEEKMKNNLNDVTKGEPKVSIIVLCYNNLEKCTKSCIESILKSKNKSAYELIVVDNASTDKTVDWLKEKAVGLNNIKIIANKYNEGFARGNNIGIKVATGEYIIILNNDTIVTDFWIDNLCNPLKNETVGAVGPLTNCIDSLQEVKIPGLDISNWEQQSKQYLSNNDQDLIYVKKLCFFCVAFKKEVLVKIGLLDEKFGLGNFEDDDLCMRISKKYKLAIAKSCFIYHQGSASFNKFDNASLASIYSENKAYFERKNSIRYSHLSKIDDAFDYFLNGNPRNIEEVKYRKRFLKRALTNAKIDEDYLYKNQVENLSKKQLIKLVDKCFFNGIITTCYRKIKKKLN